MTAISAILVISDDEMQQAKFDAIRRLDSLGASKILADLLQTINADKISRFSDLSLEQHLDLNAVLTYSCKPYKVAEIGQVIIRILNKFSENDSLLAESLYLGTLLEGVQNEASLELIREITKRMSPDNLSFVDGSRSVISSMIENGNFSSQEICALVDRLNKEQVSQITEDGSDEPICDCMLNYALHQRFEDETLVNKIAAKTKTGLIAQLAEFYKSGKIHDKYVGILKELAVTNDMIALLALKKLGVDFDTPSQSSGLAL